MEDTTAGEDYLPTSGTLTFAYTEEGANSRRLQSFRVGLVDDNVSEHDEAFDLVFTGANAQERYQFWSFVLIVDDDEPSSAIRLSAAPSRIAEDGGTAEIAVTAEFDKSARTEATEVSVSVSGSNKAGTVKFDPVPDFTITIPARETSGRETFTLTPEDNEVDEKDQTLAVEGVADLPVAAATVVLEDDDEESTGIALTLNVGRVREDDGARIVTVTATLDRAARTKVTKVAISVGGSGRPEVVDFRPVPGFSLKIRAGEASGTNKFVLRPEDDRLDEADETVSVDGSADLP